MRVLQRIFVLGVLSSLMTGCAVPPKADSASGFPEVSISASVDRVRSEVINFSINQSYEIQTETPTTLTFGRDDTMEKSIWYINRNRHYREFIIVPEGNRTRLIVKPYTSQTCHGNWGECPPSRSGWSLRTDFYSLVTQELLAVKAKSEAAR